MTDNFKNGKLIVLLKTPQHDQTCYGILIISFVTRIRTQFPHLYSKPDFPLYTNTCKNILKLIFNFIVRFTLLNDCLPYVSSFIFSIRSDEIHLKIAISICTIASSLYVVYINHTSGKTSGRRLRD